MFEGGIGDFLDEGKDVFIQATESQLSILRTRRADSSFSDQVQRLIRHSLRVVIHQRPQSYLQALVERSYALNLLRQAVHFEPWTNATMRATFTMAVFEVMTIFPLLKEVYIANRLIDGNM